MKPDYKKAVIIQNTEIRNGIFKLSISNIHGQTNGRIRPGQFYMLRCWNREPLLSRPISICGINEKEIIFMYSVLGKGTKLLSSMKCGDELEVMGPLGNGFDVDIFQGRVAVVTGGIGIAPMVQLVKELKECTVDLYAGFRNEVYAIDEISNRINETYISTEDGNIGHKGYVTDMLDVSKYDTVLCCGPEIMMEKVVRMCREQGIPVYVSMEKHMACGIGACLVCTCKTKQGNKRTCKDGPVFYGDNLEL